MTSLLPVTDHGRLEPPDGADSLLTVNLTKAGPIAIWTDGPVAATRTDGHPRTRIEPPARAMIVEYLDCGDPVVSTPVTLPVAHPLLDVLPDGSFLVVGSRCAWRRGIAEHNALIIDREGQFQTTGCLGDGIEDLHVDELGTIWVSYFDEGVIGNFGWGTPGPEPLGAPGIVQWSSRFEKLWWASDPTIVDTYALNVAPGATWAVTYTDFPLRQIRGGAMITTQPTGVEGPQGVVVAADGRTVALLGSYDDPCQVVIGTVTQDRFQPTRRARLDTGDATRWSAVICRGPEAHLFAGTRWLSWSINEL